MALNIDGSTIGYDTPGVGALKEQIHRQCIQETVDVLTACWTKLQDAVDQAWVGHSAEVFKNNFSHDVNSLKGALKQTDEILDTELDNIVKLLQATDSQLVQDRSNQ